MDTKSNREGKMEEGGYRLSRKEFVDVLGAIRDIPRIYEEIAKIESHIEKITLRQDAKIEGISDRLLVTVQKVEDINRRLDESPYVESSKQTKKEEAKVPWYDSPGVNKVLIAVAAILMAVATLISAKLGG